MFRLEVLEQLDEGQICSWAKFQVKISSLVGFPNSLPKVENLVKQLHVH
jgi:hypothetical protein